MKNILKRGLIAFLKNLINSFLWYFGNIAFGLFPLVFVESINSGTNEKVGAEEVASMISSGVHIFVCLAVMGAVMIDYVLSDIKVSGLDAFAIYLVPGIVLFVVSVQYLLTLTNFLPRTVFDLESSTSKAIFIVSAIYCILGRASLKFKEGIHHGRYV